MVTRSQVDKLASQIERLSCALGVDQPIKVTVFNNEMEAFAMERHRTLRPEHAGRLVRFNHEAADRTELSELFAVSAATPAEEAELKVWFDKLLDEISEKMRDNILSLPTTPEEVEAERAYFESLRREGEERARSADGLGPDFR
jgi:hypothetical protein